jgi:asparagine synthase (glutamine-hydrolysing)
MIERSVKKMMVADVEIGCFLSGGIDSSLVASLMQKNSIKKIKTFSIGFYENEYDESVHAKKIADYLNTDHSEIKLSANDLINNIYKIPQLFDEPFGDSSCLPTEIICKHASKNVKVVLSGDGADEIFLGYNRYLFGEKIRKLNTIVPLIFRNILSKILRTIPNEFYNLVSNPIRKSLGLQGLTHKIEKVAKLLNFESNSDFYKKLNIIDNELSDFLEDQSSLFEQSNKLQFIESIQENDLNYYLSNDILVKVDRCSMFHSLEVRAPFLDVDLTNFASAIPVNQKLKNNKLKFTLKEILKNYLPIYLFDRPKMGFAIPIEKWLNQKETSKIFDEIFYETEWNEVFLDKNNLVKKWESYKRFKNHIPTLIWNYAMMGLWAREN